jgi:DNA repair protein RadD
LSVTSEWVCFDHKGYPKDKALKWWRKRMTKPGVLPTSTVDAISKADALLKPSEIKVQKNGKYTEIVEFRFMPDVSSGSEGVSVSAPAVQQKDRLKTLLNAMHGRLHD